MSNGFGSLNAHKCGAIIQTELTARAHIYDGNSTQLLRKSKKVREALESCGGTWEYLPGYGTRGCWSVKAQDWEHLRKILETADLPATLYVYPGREVPKEFEGCTAFKHNRATGFYDLPV